MKTIDLTEICEKYKGKWVVFDKDHRVVSADKDLKKAVVKFQKKNPSAIPDVFKVPTKLIPYVGSGWK